MIDEQSDRDERFMRLALAEAEAAYEEGEIPVGAVIVSHGVVIARAHNQTETLHDVTAHAEMLAIAHKVKAHSVTKEEIARLVAFTKENGGIEYAQSVMERMSDECMSFVRNRVEDAAIADALGAYVDYVIGRKL